jgi:hypothetical protein
LVRNVSTRRDAESIKAENHSRTVPFVMQAPGCPLHGQKRYT